MGIQESVISLKAKTLKTLETWSQTLWNGVELECRIKQTCSSVLESKQTTDMRRGNVISLATFNARNRWPTDQPPPFTSHHHGQHENTSVRVRRETMGRRRARISRAARGWASASTWGRIGVCGKITLRALTIMRGPRAHSEKAACLPRY